MPDHYDWSRNELPLASHTYTQSAFDLFPQSPSWTSPLPSRRDMPSCPSSDADYSRGAHTYSHTSENTADIDAYNIEHSSSAMLQGGDFEPVGMYVGSWATPTQSPPLEHAWGIMDGDLSPPFDFTLHDSNIWRPEACGTHIHSPINTLNPAEWSPYAYGLEHSSPGNLHYDSPLCDLSPVSPMHEQSGHVYRCDSAGPYMMDMRPADDPGLISPRWDAIDPGPLGESADIPILPGALGPKYNSTRASEAESFQGKGVLGPISEDVGSSKSGSRSSCSRCLKRFSHSTDLTRHMKTQHGLAGEGYRCAFPGCHKVHKVWSRLDSFKKHMRKQHQVESSANMKGWVEKSATGEHGLPIAMTSLSGQRAGPFASQVHHSVSL